MFASLRARFSDPEDNINPLHGADNEEQVQREMNIFFPMETTVAVIKPEVYEKENERGIYDVRSCLKRFRIYSKLQLNKPKFLGYAIL